MCSDYYLYSDINIPDPGPKKKSWSKKTQKGAFYTFLLFLARKFKSLKVIQAEANQKFKCDIFDVFNPCCQEWEKVGSL